MESPAALGKVHGLLVQLVHRQVGSPSPAPCAARWWAYASYAAASCQCLCAAIPGGPCFVRAFLAGERPRHEVYEDSDMIGFLA